MSDDILNSVDDADDGPQSDSAAEPRRGLRRGFLKAAGIQDKLLEKLLQQIIPTEDPTQDGDMAAEVGGGGGGSSSSGSNVPSSSATERPNFNITTMSNNFRRFNARIGVVFKFQNRVMRLLAWRRPAQTLSALAVYTFVCLDPYLLSVLPLAVVLLGVLVPSFMARHPAAPTPQAAWSSSSSAPGSGGGGGGSATAGSTDGHLTPTSTFSPRGPPLAPARTVKPVRELSRDFFRNMRDLQNSMDDFSRAHDQVASTLVPLANFSDEGTSTALFVALTLAAAALSLAAHLLPWRALFLAAGWALVWSGHPGVARALTRSHSTLVAPREKRAQGMWAAWIASDIILDEAPETREVEMFELQRRSDYYYTHSTGGNNSNNSGGGGGGGGEWEAWLFSPTPYDPLSAARIAGERPRGTRFFEDVRAPEGWEWSEKKWALDLWSREWVEERIITGVEVETEGERWVYDMFREGENKRVDDGNTAEVEIVVDEAAAEGEEVGDGGDAQGEGSDDRWQEQQKKTPARPPQPPPNLSWEEGFEGVGRRGEWRRRRWVRLVKRKSVVATKGES